MPRRRAHDDDEQQPVYEAVLDPGEHTPEPGPDGVSPPLDLDIVPSADVKRPRSGRERKTVSRSTAVKAGQQVLATVHTVAAKGLDEPALALSPEEAKRLSEVSIDLLEAYGHSLSTNPKMAAWITWATVWGEAEVPRIIILVKRPPRRRNARPPEGEAPPIVLPEMPVAVPQEQEGVAP
jgi:hypothetical protein